MGRRASPEQAEVGNPVRSDKIQVEESGAHDLRIVVEDQLGLAAGCTVE